MKGEVSIRVRYAETDKMGFVYYGNYATYFEVARVETLRQHGISYKEMEDNGFLWPVLEFSIKYFKPAYYDELLTITCEASLVSSTRVVFEQCTYNAEKVLLNKGHVTLVSLHTATMKPAVIPDAIMKHLKSKP